MRPGPLTKSEKERKYEIEEWNKTHDFGRAPVCLRGCGGTTTGVNGSLTIGPLIRTCPECNNQFYFVQGPYQNNDGLKTTQYRNQKKCPDCKDQEKEKPSPRPCKWCGYAFTPKRRNDAETCSATCRKKRSDYEKIKK